MLGGSGVGGWACFYRDAGYRGPRFCLGAGTVRTSLAAEWRSAISSVRVAPGTVIRLCPRPRLAGRCGWVSSDRPELGDLDDATASLAVYGSDPRAL